MEPVAVGQPLAEPVTLEQAKAHLGVTWASQDDLIRGMLLAAREHVEALSRRSLALQVWEASAAAFPSRGLLTLHGPPVVQVHSVEHVDGAGAWQTIAAGDYDLVRDGLHPAFGKVWPHVGDALEPVRVRYTAGYVPALLTFATVEEMEGSEAEEGAFAHVTGGSYYRLLAGVWEATGYARLQQVPHKAVQAILLMLGQWFENREDSVRGTIVSDQPYAVLSLCRALRP